MSDEPTHGHDPRKKNGFGVTEIPNDLLRAENLPPEDFEWDETVMEFALTYDGYSAGGFERCAEIGNRCSHEYRASGRLPKTLDDLRTCLFFEQRRWRHFGEDPDPVTLQYLRAVVDAIRAQLPTTRM